MFCQFHLVHPKKKRIHIVLPKLRAWCGRKCFFVLHSLKGHCDQQSLPFLQHCIVVHDSQFLHPRGAREPNFEKLIYIWSFRCWRNKLLKFHNFISYSFNWAIFAHIFTLCPPRGSKFENSRNVFLDIYISNILKSKHFVYQFVHSEIKKKELKIMFQ